MEQVFYENDENEPTIPPKRKRLEYREIERFTDEINFDQWINTTYWTRHRISIGVTTYVCKFSLKKGYKCSARLRVIRPQGNATLIRVEEASTAHDHEPKVPLKGPLKLTEQAKQIIIEKLKDGRTAQDICLHFQDLYRTHLEDVPGLLQIQNCVKRHRKSTSAQPTLAELKDAIIGKFPESTDDPHKTILIDYKLENEKFIFIWSTNQLIELMRSQSAFHLDATYKITFGQFPILISGFSDARHKFYPTLLALSSHEDSSAFEAIIQVIKQKVVGQFTLIGDGARAISLACSNQGIKRASCWFHCMKALEKRMKKKELDWTSVKNKINLLQIANSDGEFFHAASLLRTHLRNTVDQRTFSEYEAWSEEWIGRWIQQNGALQIIPSHIYGWFEGYGEFPSTNNGLESYNEKFKTRETFRKKIPLLEFLTKAEQTVYHMSSCPDHQHPATFPKLDKFLFEQAEVLMKEKRMVATKGDLYLMPSGKFAADCTMAYLDETFQILSQYTSRTWKEFEGLKKLVHILFPSKTFTNFYFCSCHTGAKNSCKHSVFIMQHITKTLVNPYSMSNPIEPKRKRGRPSLAKNALSRD